MAPTQVNSTLPTPQQIKLVQDSYKLVEPNSEQISILFYNRLFQLEPSLQALFEESIEEQGKKLMLMLKAAVTCLNDLDNLVPILEHLAERHSTYGTKASHFTPVGNALLHTLEQELGKEFTPEIRDAWIIVIHFIASAMKPKLLD